MMPEAEAQTGHRHKKRTPDNVQVLKHHIEEPCEQLFGTAAWDEATCQRT